MNKKDLIKVMSDAYDKDGTVACYYKYPKSNLGDTLAKFIAIEFDDYYKPDERAEFDCVTELIASLEFAAEQLNNVAYALSKHIQIETRKHHRKIKQA